MARLRDELDPAFRALANATRRAMLDALRAGPRSTGEMCEIFPSLSRYAVMQHLDVLARAGLVVSRKDGRQRIHHLNVVPIRLIYERWVKGYEDYWSGLLAAVKADSESPANRRAARE